MPTLRYDPWAAMTQVQDEMNKLFGRLSARDEENGTVVTADWVPAVDIKEEPGRFLLRADVPGVELKDIELTLEAGVLTLRGVRPYPVAAEGQDYKRTECPRGVFYRRFALPDAVDSDGVTARCSNGVLDISIPKHERLQPRKITVE